MFGFTAAVEPNSSSAPNIYSRDGRACQPKARRSSESAIAAEVFMNNAGRGGRWTWNAFRSPKRSTVFVAIRGSQR